MQLAERGNIIHAGIGPRVGKHDNAVSNEDAAAVSHAEAPAGSNAALMRHIYSDEAARAAIAGSSTLTLTVSSSPSPP